MAILSAICPCNGDIIDLKLVKYLVIYNRGIPIKLNLL